LQCSIPSTIKFNKIAQAFRPRTIQRIKLADFISVARVRPRTSKGITAVTHVHGRRRGFGYLDLFPVARSPEGLARTSSRDESRPTPWRALRRPLAKGLATGSAHEGFPCTRLSCASKRRRRSVPKNGDSSTRMKALH
jgi:hypothetical protein